MRYLLAFVITIFFSQITVGQTPHEEFIKALIAGDTVLAAKIEKDNAYIIEPIEEKPFPVRNNSEYIFQLGISQLKDTITALFNIENQDNNRFLTPIFYDYMSEDDTSQENRISIPFNAETSKNPLFGKHYFDKQGTLNDIYIHNFGVAWPSKLYFSNDEPLKYRTAFIIKLFTITDNSTKALIIANDPKVINGMNGFAVHGPIARETSVNPSSIEEYSLLLFISDKLGEKNLPPLKLPNTH